jgi:hypothetical protein
VRRCGHWPKGPVRNGWRGWAWFVRIPLRSSGTAHILRLPMIDVEDPCAAVPRGARLRAWCRRPIDSCTARATGVRVMVSTSRPTAAFPARRSRSPRTSAGPAVRETKPTLA